MNRIRKKLIPYHLIVYPLFVLVILVVLFPLYWILIASISEPDLVNAGKVILWPQEVTFAGYKKIFTFDSIMTGYINSILYTLLGTAINVVLTLMAGYVLSRKDLAGRRFLMILFIIPMYFSGGMIPTYLTVDSLRMVDTIWAMVIPNALSIFNVILARTFFQNTIPDGLLESAQLDGCSNIRFFLRIALPLSMALVSILVIYYGSGHWNSYFHALIYMRSSSKLPLQVVLREILIAQSDNNNMFSMLVLQQSEMERHKLAQLIRYGIVIVSSAPLLIIYPFLQKYFEKGVMIGSIKG